MNDQHRPSKWLAAAFAMTARRLKPITRAVGLTATQARTRTRAGTRSQRAGRRRALHVRPALNTRIALAGVLLVVAIGLSLGLLLGGGESKRTPVRATPPTELASAHSAARYTAFDPLRGRYSQRRLSSCFAHKQLLTQSGAGTLSVRLPNHSGGTAPLTLRFYRSWAEAQRAGLMSRTASNGRKAIGNVLVVGNVTDGATVRALVSCFTHRAHRPLIRRPGQAHNERQRLTARGREGK